MSDALYAKLKAVEPTVAEEYKAVVKNDVVDVEGLKKIILKIIAAKGPAGGDISSKEAQALVLIIESGELSEKAKTQLLDALRQPQVMERVLNGSSVVLKNGESELETFLSVFAIKHTGKIKFYSKGTNLTYSPSQYQAIAQLVKDGKISVVKIMDAGLSAQAGVDAVYSAESNAFLFPEHKGEAFFSMPSEIVHEATHAVQDWFDVNSTVRFVEADAYVAQAVAETNPKLRKELKAAAKFVTDGTAVKGNKAWYDAYDAVVAMVDVHPNYKDRKDDDTKKMIEKAANEPKEFQKVLNALSAPAKAPPTKAKASPTP